MGSHQQSGTTANQGFPIAASTLLKIGTGGLIGILTYVALPGDPGELSEPARLTAAIGAMMAVWWMTEALPLAVTALVPVALFPLADVGSVGEITAHYADPVIFLFLGGFLLALAMQSCGLHRRIALLIVLAVGVQPSRLVAGFMLATAFLSMWISNTAAAVMMLPIGTSIVLLVEHQGWSDLDDPPGHHPVETATFATGLMLGIAYAASIGSLTTPIGTPPNLFLIGFLEQNYGIAISFGQWMLFALPIAIVLLPAAWYLLVKVLYQPGFDAIPAGRQMIQLELYRMGSLSRAERLVATVFVSTVLAWILRDPLTGWDWLAGNLPAITRLTDPGIAIIAAITLFAIPFDWQSGERVLTWNTAEDVPWNVLLLFGGGLTLAAAVSSTGLDRWIGTQLSGLTDLPIVLLVAGVTAVIIILTELTSNTATVATFLPILAGVAVVSGLDSMLLVVPCALAGTCAFMLPVATPPNAIVFGSGEISIWQMARAGVVLNLLAIALITVGVILLGPPILGIDR